VDEVVDAIDSIFLIPPTEEDVAELRADIYDGRNIDSKWREACDTSVFFDKSRDMSLCIWIAENSDTSLLAQRLLLDGISCLHASTIISIKSGRNVTQNSVSLFKKCFWDTDELSRIDFNNYYSLGGYTSPDPPMGVPLSMRPHMAAWQNGIIPGDDEVSTEDIIKTIQIDSFMTYQKSRVSTCRKEREESIKWANLALKTSSVRNGMSNTKKDDQDIKIIVKYPQLNVVSLEEINQEDEEDPI